MRWLLARRLVRETSGHVAIMTAIMTPVALTLAAFAVDVGSLYVEKREAQALTDLAAITAAANLDKAQAASLLTMTDNGVAGIVARPVAADGSADFDHASVAPQVAVVTGRYEPDPATPAAARFVPSAKPANAARVVYRRLGARYFAASIIPPPEIVTTAIAGMRSEAAFSIGSRLAKLEGGIANAVLGSLLGSEIELSVMDYEALLSSRVELLSFLDALASELDITAGSYQEVLDADVGVGLLARTISRMPEVDGSAKTAASKLAFQVGGGADPTLRLSRLIGLASDGSSALRASIRQLGAEIGVMELLGVSALAAGNGRQVSLDLGANIPGLAAVSVDLAIGEPPQHGHWFSIGSGGDLVRTAQTRLAIVAEIAGPGGLLGTKIRLPLYLELAFAEAKLKSVTCSGGHGGDAEVKIDARPGIANLYLAEIDPSKIADFANPAPRSPARLVQAPLVRIEAQAQAEIAETEYHTLVFSANDIAKQRMEQVSTDEIATSLTKSLFSSLELDIEVAGLGLGLPPNLTGLLGNTIGAAAPAVDTLLETLLTTLGLSLGQADVRVHSASCGRPVLLQ